MTVIHVRRDGQVYKATLEGEAHYTAGYGATWQEAIGSLIYIVEGTPLLPGIRLDIELSSPIGLLAICAARLSSPKSDGAEWTVHDAHVE